MNRGIFKLLKYKDFFKKTSVVFWFIALENIMVVIISPYFYNLILNDKLNSGNMKEVVVFGTLFIILSFLRGLETHIANMRQKKCNMEMAHELRIDVFNHLQDEKINYYDNTRSSDTFELLVGDNEEASNLLPNIFMKLYVAGAFRALILIIIMLMIDYKLGLFTILFYFIGYAIIISANKISTKILAKKRKVNMDLVNFTNEATDGFQTIKTLGIENQRKSILNSIIDRFTLYTNDLDLITRRYTFAYQIVTFFITLNNVYSGSLDIIGGICTYAGLMMIIEYSNNASNYINWIVEGMPTFNSNKLAFNKILDYLNNSQAEVTDQGETLNKVEKIEFKNVSFAYDKQNVINNFNLVVNGMEKIALIGKTGCGKSTIINLLCQFYTPSMGNILINDKPISSYKLRDLRSKIGYVMQDNIIFDGTIIENINYASADIPRDEIISICKRLNLHDRISKLPNGYDTTITSEDNFLSVGEKQLINFARIMAINPEIIILDEVTSSLSYETEMLIQNAIKEITKNKICFIIAHRLSTIKDCDKIVFMEKGNVKEIGNHQELLNLKGIYYGLVNEK